MNQMPTRGILYRETLKPGELAFLENLVAKEKKTYYKIFTVMMIFSFVFPFLGSWYRAYEGAENAFSYSKFFTSVTALLTVTGVATWFGFYVHLRKIIKDIQENSKTVAVTRIKRKTHITTNNTFYFYIDSIIKLSIEVSAEDFQQYNEGDDICIEYTTNAQKYLGYF